MSETITVLEDIKQLFINEYEEPDGYELLPESYVRDQFSHVSDTEFDWCIEKLIFDEVIERSTEEGVAYFALTEKMQGELMSE